MLLLPRLTSRSSRSLAVMLVCGQASRGTGDWPAGFPREASRVPRSSAAPAASSHRPLLLSLRFNQVVS